MRSKFPGGRAARSTPARSNSLAKCPPDRTPRLRMRRPDESSERSKKPATPVSPVRVAAFQTGISAESRAAAFLIAKGYRILARRFRTPHGEIDIVARRRNLLA